MDAKQLCALLNGALKDDGANFLPHYRGAMWPMGDFRRSGNDSDEFVRTRDGAIVARIEGGKMRVRVDYPTEQDIGGHEFKPSDSVDFRQIERQDNFSRESIVGLLLKLRAK